MELRQHHVLYIEDHEDTRELITLVLSERNYRVTTGATIVDGLKLSREHHFDPSGCKARTNILPNGKQAIWGTFFIHSVDLYMR